MTKRNNTNINTSRSFESDEVSVASSQQVIDSIQKEKYRRSARTKEMRTKSDRKGRRAPTISSGSGGIMSIRTLEESLETTRRDGNWKNVVDNRRKRRVLQRKVDGVIKHVNNGHIKNLTPQTISSSDIDSLGSNLTNSSSVTTEKLRVRFDQVTVREHYMIAGDNPEIARGPPITIAWKHNHEQTYDFEYFEHRRAPQRRLRTQMKMPPFIREDILIKSGYSYKEIREVTKEAAIIRRQRRRSIDLEHTDNVVEKVESIKKIFGRPFRSKEEKEEEMKMKEYYKMSRSQDSQKKDDNNLDTTKRTDNLAIEGEKDDESDESDEPSSITTEGISALDTSRSGRKYDLSSKKDRKNDIDSSKNGNKYNLLPLKDSNGEHIGDECNVPEDDFRGEMDSSRRGKKYDLLGESKDKETTPYDDQESIDSENDAFFCLPEGIFLSMFWQEKRFKEDDEKEVDPCCTN
eukprot:CAMPEP_0203667992 /NCGR_PEP_ID=MMETSP0090-20130426/4712_1 /ASSEMBLY_ACC=CAM_ASM_001088 /TAXON_ID=426623 /ORGANISM="Chaetoceros affinis, Strain CCMP159" /LENGTH=461 /DNA_ID=CAMNT_0050532303 /DNA_START=142 /DNA_END=1527 /DNA_ORIENTATION=-